MEVKKTILVTRELRSDALIRQWALERNFHLIAQAFIETVAVTGLEIPETDWIFFSSPQSVELYFAHYPLKAKKIAALSEGTAHALLQLRQTPSFVGNPNKVTKQIGQDFFAQLAADEAVLFPLSDISKRQISSQGTQQRIHELVTYRTALKGIRLPQTPAVILFTSPSNVDGYLLQNKISTASHLLAIGHTTADHLKHLGYTRVTVSESTQEKMLIRGLESLL